VSETKVFETNSAAETDALGARLARALNAPAIVLLSGELGAGKTVFVRGMLKGLDAPADVRVTSPTYVLLHSYKGGRATLHHIDAYRLRGGADELADSGLLECFDDAGAITCIEWPQRVGNVKFPGAVVKVRIEHVGALTRTVEIEGGPELSHVTT